MMWLLVRGCVYCLSLDSRGPSQGQVMCIEVYVHDVCLSAMGEIPAAVPASIPYPSPPLKQRGSRVRYGGAMCF